MNKNESNNDNNKVSSSNNNRASLNDTQNLKKSEGRSLFTRIFAIAGLIVIAGLYILSLVSSLADWENSFGIFTGALAATIFVPIVIYLFKIFSNKDN